MFCPEVLMLMFNAHNFCNSHGIHVRELLLPQKLVETAMMAAVGGLAFVLATTLKLEGYMGYFLPLPVVLSGMKAGPGGARKTFTATIFLLLGGHTLIWIHHGYAQDICCRHLSSAW